MNAAPRPSRSLIVSWLLGATVVALVTFSFEALSAREAATGRCPVTGAVSASVEAGSSSCPALERRVVCPANGATTTPERRPRRCPAGGHPSAPVAGISVI